MKKKRGWQSAGDFMAELEQDPEYMRMRAEKDERHRLVQAQCDQILQPILERLADAGFPANSIQQVVAKFAPLPQPAVEILLDSLKGCREVRVQESLVRALGAAEFRFDGQPLAKLFTNTSDEGLRFAIFNTIALVRPTSISEWLDAVQQNDYYRQKLTDLGYDWTQGK